MKQQTNRHFLSHLAHLFLQCEMCQAKFVEKIKTHILSSVTFFENYVVSKIMLKNIVQLERPQMTIWRMHISRWVPEATKTHSEYVIVIVFPFRQWLHKSASVLRYTYVSCLVIAYTQYTNVTSGSVIQLGGPRV